MFAFLNFSWFTLEFFMGFAILSLLIWGVIYTKKGGIISFSHNLYNLSILTVILAFIIIINQYISIITNPNMISISGGILTIDAATILIKGIITIFGGLILFISKDKTLEFEYVILYLIAILGMFLLVSSNDLIMMYLSIELISLSLYILAAWNKQWEGSAEAGLKYFILGALSSGLLISGSVILYMITGETSLSQLALYIWYNNGNSLGIEIGGILIVVALLFKLGAAPFHMWVPDVYEGSPTYVTAYFAILPKIATLGILYKLSMVTFIAQGSNSIQEILLWCGLASIIIGSIGAINQTKIKRLLAYSAISHMGFMLLGLGVGTMESITATFIYIGVYMIMSLNTFSIVLNKGYTYVSEFSGISRKDPVLAITLGLGFLSIAGIPPLAGFYSKYAVLLAVVGGGLNTIAIIAVLASVIGGFYYIRVVKWIYFNDSKDFFFHNLGSSSILIDSNPIKVSNSIIIGITLYLVLTMWIYPTPFIEIIFTGILSGSLV